MLSFHGLDVVLFFFFRQKKETDLAGSNDALTLLHLQQQVITLTTAKTALEDVQRQVHETALHNFTSAKAAKRKPCLSFQTSTSSCLTAMDWQRNHPTVNTAKS